MIKKLFRAPFYFLVYYLFSIKVHPEFVFLFYKKEGKALLGKRYFNFWFLILSFLLTFLAVGFANGSLRYLQKKMDDPFVSWLNIDIPTSKSGEIEEIIHSLRNDSVNRLRFKYKFITGYNFWSLNIYDNKKDKSRRFYGRTIDVRDPLLKEILSERFFIYGRDSGFTGNKDVGLIITKRLMDLMNYKESDGYIAMDFSDNETPRRVLIPVVAVVRELPNFTDFLCTQHFHDQRNVSMGDGNPYSPENIRSVSFITKETAGNAAGFQEKIKARIQSLPEFKNLEINFPRYSENTLSCFPYSQVDVTIFDDTSLRVRDAIARAIETMPGFDATNYQRYYDYYPNLSSDDNIRPRFDRISIEFPDRDKVKAFKKFMAEPPYGLNIELGQIEAMENYNFITKLTRIISMILMVFSITVISLFISNLMQNHLEKIKMNIGTFLAFGINPRALERIYLSMIYLVLLMTMITGLFIAYTVGNLGFVRLILSALGERLEENQTYYDQFSNWTLILLATVLLTSYISIVRVTRKVFGQTPGDLLYERT